jgi:sugar phosphate isomerase/epimerase
VKIGACVWPFKWSPPYEETITRLAKANFDAVELMAWEESVLGDYYTAEEIKNLKSIIAGHGLELNLFYLPYGEAASADASERQHYVEMAKRGIDIGVELGAPVINSTAHLPFGLPYPRINDRVSSQIFTVDVPSGLDWKGNWEQYTDVIRECAEYAGQAGVMYTLEPHPFRYGANADGLLRILETVDSPHLGINFDPSHLFPMGEMLHVAIYRLGDRIRNCHFSDNDGETNRHFRPGKGKMDWKSVLQALKDTGFSGVISLELEDVPGVSRGPNSDPGPFAERHPREKALPSFEEEYFLGRSYLQDIADEIGF